MPFYIRRSKSFGPLRINLSRSGIGASLGVKGARIGTGPKGSYVHVGRGGVYYRQRIGGRRQSAGRSAPRADTSQQPNEAWITTAPVEELVDASPDEIVRDLNLANSRQPYVYAAAAVTILVTVGALSVSMPVLAAIAFVAGAIGTYRIHHLIQAPPLEYDLEPEVAAQFQSLEECLEQLASARCLWRVLTETPTSDWKRNSGASRLDTRRPAQAGRVSTPNIRTNLDVLGIDCSGIKLLFFPDRLFVYQHGKYATVLYRAFSVLFTQTRFTESDGAPSDATVVGTTWRFVNRDGGPDRRFNSNRQLPVCLYGQLTLTSASGLNVHLHVSSVSIAEQFASKVKRITDRLASKE